MIAVGRITPELAEDMIADGECDFVAMGRQLLADQRAPRKGRCLLRRHAGELRCIYG